MRDCLLVSVLVLPAVCTNKQSIKIFLSLQYYTIICSFFIDKHTMQQIMCE